MKHMLKNYFKRNIGCSNKTLVYYNLYSEKYHVFPDIFMQIMHILVKSLHNSIYKTNSYLTKRTFQFIHFITTLE